jgi:hypothetical protein
MGDTRLNTADAANFTFPKGHAMISTDDLTAITTVEWTAQGPFVLDRAGHLIARADNRDFARQIAMLPEMATDLLRLRAEVINLREKVK